MHLCYADGYFKRVKVLSIRSVMDVSGPGELLQPVERTQLRLGSACCDNSVDEAISMLRQLRKRVKLLLGR